MWLQERGWGWGVAADLNFERDGQRAGAGEYELGVKEELKKRRDSIAKEGHIGEEEYGRKKKGKER